MSDDSRAGASTQREAQRLMWWLLLPVLALLVVLSVLQYQQRVADAERGLLHRAGERALELQALARPAVAHLSDMARLLEQNWDDPAAPPEDLMRALRPLPDPREPSRIDGWVLDGASADHRERYGQIWWGSQKGEPPSQRWMQRAALFQRAARVVMQRAPGFEGSFFVATERNVSWGYPFMATAPMLRAMGVDSLLSLDDLRLRDFAAAKDRMERTGERAGRWGRPYASQLHGELVQSYAEPLYVRGRHEGELSVDYRLDEIQKLGNRWQDTRTRVWVVSRQRDIVADSQAPLSAPGGPGKANQPVLMPLESRLPAAPPAGWLDTLASLGEPTLLQLPGTVLVASSREGTPWIYVQAVPVSALRDEVLPSLLPNALLGAALLFVFVLGQWLFARWFVAPSLGVLGHLRELTVDPSVPAPHLGPRWEGWIQAVRRTVLNQHAAREQLDRQRDAMRQSEKLSLMGTLLAGVAHELNNPLAIVMGRAALLEDRVLAATDAHSESGRAVRDDTRRIREAAERCGRIVRTFLNMARQRPPVRSQVHLAEVVRAAVDMLGHSLRSQDVRVVVDMPADLPPVHADPDLLGQLVLNLMVNAQQAMQQASAERVLSLSAGTGPVAEGPPGQPPVVWLCVSDTGPGIAPDVRDLIFEPFFTTKDAGSGTGLGLNVSRNIAREHGGELACIERAGGGACFRLSLPQAGRTPDSPSGVIAVAGGHPQPVWSRPAQDPGAAAADAGRVLLAEDDAELAEITRRMLEGLGWEVVQAESGAVALELLEVARFDAIVAAVGLPDLDGAALWRVVCERQPGLDRRLLFVTGDTLSPRSRRLREITGCPSLDRPFARQDLQQALQALLRDAQQRPASPSDAWR